MEALKGFKKETNKHKTSCRATHQMLAQLEWELRLVTDPSS